ncbi:MAG: ABC transporter ATP-binding protein [Burkholderiaceae bacterium]|nr:ABC transporter ATP-binding protein [Burkholderiaceae bacterium]
MSRASGAPVVAFRRVSFGYGERPVIDAVSFEIKAGQVVALMGGSGVGKTTLLRLISGLVGPQQGIVEVFGNPLNIRNQSQLYIARRRMGLLFQFGALFTDLSCYENVAFPIREHTDLSESMIHDLVMLKLECVGLRGAASLKPSEISGGMARRVALARAIALDPELILYDEPFAGLDPISLGVTANLIRGLNTALGATSIVVTHDVAETFAIADRIVVFAPSPNGARLVAQGTPDELRVSQDPFVRQFLDGRMDGPVRFHYPAEPIGQALGIGGPG